MIVKNNIDKKEISTKKRSQLKSTWIRFKRNKLAMFGLVILSILIVLAILAPVIVDYEEAINLNVQNRFERPSSEYLLGTDHFGRDLFARIIFGARYSLFAGLMSVLIASIIGTLIGAIAGYYGGIVESILMRIIDVVMALPSFLLAISIVAALGSGLPNLVIAISISFIAPFARIIRSSVLSIRNQEFIEAAIANGTPNRRIIVKHVIPNSIGPLLVQATLSIGEAILLISGLSFLGLGVQPPTPEWGSMLSDARPMMRSHPHLVVIPGIAIILAVMGLNLIGDGLRDALDPRLKN